jgi:hypothetical protein
MPTARNVEIERNFQFFQGFVSKLLPAHAGKYALLRHEGYVAVYDTVVDAVHAGSSKFDDDLFSIQEVTDAPLDLGFFSHANPVGRVR